MDDSIPISALQHYVFCPRQCAYIHIERVWQDNYLTALGNQLHQRVHSHEAETRVNLRTERSVQVQSQSLGIHGQLDLLEIRDDPLCLTPVEYKRGKPKVSDCDRVQLCAQVLCLEDMRDVSIKRAALWYWQVRKREWIAIDQALRRQTQSIISATRALLAAGELPAAGYSSACKACSLFDLCMPKQNDHSQDYVKQLFCE
ncbi:MAG TPA: CRISPR-associated protein Cas4 [Crenotrichaceae bacterium]|nr:CRISPR-associated protein Cas4 [Crenotrichaceae bacterium]